MKIFKFITGVFLSFMTSASYAGSEPFIVYNTLNPSEINVSSEPMITTKWHLENSVILVDGVAHEIEGGRYKIILRGRITEEVGAAFTKALSYIPDNTDFMLDISSMGGRQSGAQDIIDAMRSKCENGLKCSIWTYVAENERCHSACVPIFTSGRYKIAEENAEFGFHYAAFTFNGSRLFTLPKRTRTFLVSNGVPESWYDEKVNEGAFEDDFVKTAEELRQESSGFFSEEFSLGILHFYLKLPRG